MSAPYLTTALFDAETLPAGLKKEHRTKAGVWGLIRVLEGTVRLRVLSPPSELMLTPDIVGLVLPEQPHELDVDPNQPFRLQVEFYRENPV